MPHYGVRIRHYGAKGRYQWNRGLNFVDMDSLGEAVVEIRMGRRKWQHQVLVTDSLIHMKPFPMHKSEEGVGLLLTGGNDAMNRADELPLDDPSSCH